MTAPHYTDETVTLYAGDALDVLSTLPDQSVDAVVTDPPAGVSFMSRSWDDDKGGREQWSAWLAEIMREALRVVKPGGHALVWALPRTSHWTACGLEDAGWQIRDRISHLFGSGFPKALDVGRALRPIDSDAADRWEGWATALKPSAEDWWLCRKPLEGTVAGNVTRWGTGALNIDGCRIGTAEALQGSTVRDDIRGGQFGNGHRPADTVAAYEQNPAGRWPTNALLDTAAAQQLDRETGDAVARFFPVLSGACGDGSTEAASTSAGRKTASNDGSPPTAGPGNRPTDPRTTAPSTGSSTVAASGAATTSPSTPSLFDGPEPSTATAASAPRLTAANGSPGTATSSTPAAAPATPLASAPSFPTFAPPDPLPAWRYEPKAPTHERPVVDGEAHSTVKPLDLIRWLCRLITPPGGTVLDPFAGSGTTGEACVVEGFRAILVEREAAYLPLIVARLSKPIQPDLFGGVA